MKTLVFEIQGLPKILSNQRIHWTVRYKQNKLWKKLVLEHVKLYQLKPAVPYQKARLTLTRFAHGREPDFDNLVSSWKGIIDGLTEAGIIIDDRPDVIGRPICLWEKAAPKQGKVRIQIDVEED